MKGGKEREKRREEVVGKVKRGRYLGFVFLLMIIMDL